MAQPQIWSDMGFIKGGNGPQRPPWILLANLQKRCNLCLNPFCPHRGAAIPAKESWLSQITAIAVSTVCWPDPHLPGDIWLQDRNGIVGVIGLHGANCALKIDVGILHVLSSSLKDVILNTYSSSMESIAKICPWQQFLSRLFLKVTFSINN